MKKIVFIANLDNGMGMSGGTRIYFELLKKFNHVFKTIVFGSFGTAKRMKQEKIKYTLFIRTDTDDTADLGSMIGLFVHTARRLVGGVKSVKKNYSSVKEADFVFSVSDFWPDILPALFLKWKNPKIKWVAAFYFFAPKPWQKENPYATSISRRVAGFIYWSSQLIAYQAIKRWASFVIACNEIDRKIFINDGFPENNIVAIYGGVDLSSIKKIPAPKNKLYDAIFMARFHPQKGPLVAVKAWNELVKTNPSARLAMIGNGPEEVKVRSFIKEHKLAKNVTLLGFLDGEEKYKALKSSQIFIHPAIYETGGMAAAEGMACGLPVVAFDHEGFKYCYPQGMLRVSPIGDYRKLANSISVLIGNKKMYGNIRKQATNLVKKEWDWDKRASFVLDKLKYV